MITFKYTDAGRELAERVLLEVTTDAEHLEAAVDTFKRFLLHVGHHPDNIGRITFEENRQGLPQQLELFPEDNP